MRNSKMIESLPEITNNLVAIGGLPSDYVERLYVETGPTVKLLPNAEGEKDKVATFDIPKGYSGDRALSDMERLEGLWRMRRGRVHHPASRRNALHASIGALVRLQSQKDALSSPEKRKLGKAVTRLARQAISATTEVFERDGKGIWISPAARNRHVALHKENYEALHSFASWRSRRAIHRLVQTSS